MLGTVGVSESDLIMAAWSRADTSGKASVKTVDNGREPPQRARSVIIGCVISMKPCRAACCTTSVLPLLKAAVMTGSDTNYTHAPTHSNRKLYSKSGGRVAARGTSATPFSLSLLIRRANSVQPHILAVGS